jgi:hypothetical protein
LESKTNLFENFHTNSMKIWQDRQKNLEKQQMSVVFSSTKWT